LLDILFECANDPFSSFRDALITDGQRLIVDTYLTPKQRQPDKTISLCM